MKKNKISMLMAIILLLSVGATNAHAESVNIGYNDSKLVNLVSLGYNPGNENSSNSQSVIQFADRPDLMNLTFHNALDEANREAKAGLPTIAPIYQSTWRLQPVTVKLSSTPEATFEFANTGSKPITISDENLCFVYNNAIAENISGSKIVGGPVTVQPNTIATIKLTCTTPDTRIIRVNIGDFTNHFYWLKSASDIVEIADTAPVAVRTDRDLNTAAAINVGTIVGNGKFKYQVLGIKMLKNTEVGKLIKPIGGTLGIAKIRLANTSNEIMKIDSFNLKSTTYGYTIYPGYGKVVNPISSKNIDWTKNDQALLGENALSTEIKPNSIVEGYIPFIMYDPNETISIQGYSNLGTMDLRSVEVYSPWVW